LAAGQLNLLPSMEDQMPTALELEVKSWKALRTDLIMMVGAGGERPAPPKPMTAQFDDDHGPIWFFTTKDNSLVAAAKGKAPAVVTFTSKGHDLFATIDGTLAVDTDPVVVDRLWNRYVAAWYEGGKDDPNLTLLKFEPTTGEIWEDASSLRAGVELLFGIDPKVAFKDSVARVNLGRERLYGMPVSAESRRWPHATDLIVAERNTKRGW
jgi:general stress protein 26